MAFVLPGLHVVPTLDQSVLDSTYSVNQLITLLGGTVSKVAIYKAVKDGHLAAYIDPKTGKAARHRREIRILKNRSDGTPYLTDPDAPSEETTSEETTSEETTSEETTSEETTSEETTSEETTSEASVKPAQTPKGRKGRKAAV